VACRRKLFDGAYLLVSLHDRWVEAIGEGVEDEGITDLESVGIEVAWCPRAAWSSLGDRGSRILWEALRNCLRIRWKLQAQFDDTGDSRDANADRAGFNDDNRS